MTRHGENALVGVRALCCISARSSGEPEQVTAVHLLHPIDGQAFPRPAKHAAYAGFQRRKPARQSARLPHDFGHARVGLVLGLLPGLCEPGPDVLRVVERGLRFIDAGENLMHASERIRGLLLRLEDTERRLGFDRPAALA
jgi:hypothetical protein